MPSALPRISTVMEPALYRVIERLARKDGVTLSQKTRDLLRDALETVEDEGLERMVERRRQNKKPSISHADLKRRLGLR